MDEVEDVVDEEPPYGQMILGRYAGMDTLAHAPEPLHAPGPLVSQPSTATAAQNSMVQLPGPRNWKLRQPVGASVVQETPDTPMSRHSPSLNAHCRQPAHLQLLEQHSRWCAPAGVLGTGAEAHAAPPGWHAPPVL